ncbi:MAG: formylmethanofuran dehydrogenase subunit C [Betaproteobacteria bacterium]|nr:formylmethanofuran dehydrogenase subunit C [Betaproteobacteria bacterium]
MTRVLTLREGARPPHDLSLLAPRRLAGLSARAVERLPLPGARPAPLGEYFTVLEQGAANDELLVVRTGAAHPHGLGRDLDGGCLRIEGHAGAMLARDMRGGEIVVDGDCGDFAASGMRGGRLRVLGDAGGFLGAALPDARQGMNGGEVVVHGRAGERAGWSMRRGLLLIGEGCGAHCAAGMLAGTLVTPSCADIPALGLRRGSLVLTRDTPALAPTFHPGGEVDLVWLRLLARHTRAWLPELLETAPRGLRVCGDLACGGRGEILLLGAR